MGTLSLWFSPLMGTLALWSSPLIGTLALWKITNVNMKAHNSIITAAPRTLVLVNINQGRRPILMEKSCKRPFFYCTWLDRPRTCRLVSVELPTWTQTTIEYSGQACYYECICLNKEGQRLFLLWVLLSGRIWRRRDRSETAWVVVISDGKKSSKPCSFPSR